MVGQAEEVAKRKKGRSPSYPGIGLQEAIERARIIYRAENRHSAAIDTILSHWGYRSGSGLGLVVLAALIKFGLLADEGSGKGRHARLTEDALKIIQDEREVSPD